MCVAGAVGGVVSSVATNLDKVLGAAKGTMSVIDTVNEYKTNKKNYAYQTQIALNNAKIAQNEALRQKQLGIEKSRLEKISGLKEINQLKAKNSASNLDAMSQTNQFAYEDMSNMSEYSASLIKNEYDLNANSYFKQANSYLNQAQNYKNKYNQSLFNQSMSALGQFNQVASNWYEKKKEEGGPKIEFI